MGICCKGVIMITIEDVNKAQQAWGEGIVAISAAHSSGGDYVALATKHVGRFTHMTLAKYYSNQHWRRKSNFVQRLKPRYLISLLRTVHV